MWLRTHQNLFILRDEYRCIAKYKEYVIQFEKFLNLKDVELNDDYNADKERGVVAVADLQKVGESDTVVPRARLQ